MGAKQSANSDIHLQIRNLEVAYGDRSPIGVLDIDAEALANLSRMGFENAFVSSRSIAELMLGAAEQTLESAACSPESIDGVLIATDSHWDQSVDRESPEYAGLDGLRQRSHIFAGLSRLGVTGYPISIGMGACNNVGSVLAVGSSLVESGFYKRILVMIGDRLNPVDQRQTGSGSAVYSDAAAAFLIELGSGHWKIGPMAMQPCLRIVGLPSAAVPQKLIATNRSLRTLVQKFAERSGCRIAEYEMILTSHHGDGHAKPLIEAIGGKWTSVCREFLSGFGHCFAIDALVALRELERGGDLVPGRPILLLNTAVELWSLVEITT